MKTSEEKSFPRGGKKPIIANVNTFEKRFSFGVEKPKNVKEKRKKKSNVFSTKSKKKQTEETYDNENDYENTSEEFSFKKGKLGKNNVNIKIITNKSIPEGLVILGCIGEVSEFELKVNLPGRIIGYVPISNISHQYTNALQEVLKGENREPNKLEDMFKVGQFVVTKVVNVERLEGKRNKLTLTLNPSEIYSGWSSKNVKKGLVVSAIVRSIEDHGYVMDFGVADVRGFLKKESSLQYEKMWNDGQQLVVGQVVQCLVTKSNVLENYTTVELTSEPKAVAEASIGNVSLNMIVPGMLFNVEVTEIVRSGLVVKFANDMTGYIHEDCLKNVDTILSNIGKGKKFPGRVLYIEPYTKHIYFTLRENVCALESNAAFALKRGDIVTEAKVICGKGAVLHLQLKKGLYGIVTSRHLDKPIVADQETKLRDKLEQLYPLGSFVKCRIIGFDYMSQIFTCSLEKAILKQPYMSPSDCKPGDVVSCVIEKAAPRGIQLSIGTVRGFVEPLHFGDDAVIYPEKVFPFKKRVKAKVLKALQTVVELTLKPSLVNSTNPILSNYDEADPDKVYDGVVVLVKARGTLIKFYGNITGWLRKSYYIGSQPPNIGEVVQCKVIYADPDERTMLVSLVEKKSVMPAKSYNLKIGNFYTVRVSDIMADGLVVTVEDDLKMAEGAICEVKGIIPAQQLSDSRVIGHMLCQTFRKGDELRACCLSLLESPIFSINPIFTEFFESKVGKDLANYGFGAVTKYIPIPSLIMQITSNKLVVDIPIPGMKPAFVFKRDILDGEVEDISLLDFEIHQTLVIKMLRIMSDSNSFASSRLSFVWDRRVQSGIKLLENFLSDTAKLKHDLEVSGNPLAHLFIGAEVAGKVITSAPMGATLQLLSGANAVVVPQHFEGVKLKEEMVVKGTVMFVDVTNDCAEITLRQDMRDFIKKSYKNVMPVSEIGKVVKGQILVSHSDLMMVAIVHNNQTYVAYAPARWHINDFEPKSPKPHGMYVIKMVKDGIIICVPKKMDKDRRKKKVKTRTCDQLNTIEKDIIQNGNIMYESLENHGNEVNQTTDKGVFIESPLKKRKQKMKEVENEKIQGTNGKSPSSKKQKKTNTCTAVNTCTSPVKPLEEESQSGNNEKANNVEGLANNCIAKKELKKNSQKKKKKKNLDTHLKVEEASTVENNKVKKKRKTREQSIDSIPKKVMKGEDGAGGSMQCLDVDAGFIWDAKPEDLQAFTLHENMNPSSSEDEKEEERNLKERKKKKRLSTAEKKALVREEEERLRQIESRLMDAEKNPQSADDFDRLVMSTPNSSKNWIKYMAFHLQATEIEKARSVGERALQAISFREEQEKLNVWMALLNLENLYGTKESFDKTLQDAIQLNDDYKVNMQVLQMYADSGKMAELDKLVHTMSKKYKSNKETWIRIGEVFMKINQFDKARKLMQNALTCLQKKDHVDLIVKFALMENGNGQSERAETLMENILTSCPKRIDVWCVYVDMLVKSQKVDLARQVLERSIVQKLPAGKMKSLFNKFLKFEQNHGTPQAVEKVRQMAKDYVENAMKALGEPVIE